MSDPTPLLERVEADWEHLSTLVDPDLPGWSRTGFSEPDRAARDWILRMMREAGLDPVIDAAGNVIGRVEGSVPTSTDIVIGSHSDTVPGGGRFDGIVGVVGAIEVVRMLRARGIRLRHGLRVVDFANEEGNPQGVKLVGSRAVAGTLDRAALSSTDESGTSLAALMERAGHRPTDLGRARWNTSDLACYIELHIEQGPVLERTGTDIGVVSRICGISTFTVDVAGRRDHAGTMPMDSRQDAMCCAADTALAVTRVVGTTPGAVGTIGTITTPSPLTNTVSEAARITGEFRSPDLDELHRLQQRFESEVRATDQRHRTRSALNWTHSDEPTPMNARLSEVIEHAASAGGHSTAMLYSGATHDGVSLASLTPTAMIFIPSRDGRSHCPEEWSELEDIGRGIDVLFRTVLAVDAE